VSNRHVLVVWAAMLGWAAAIFATVRSEYERYQLGRFDLGNMTQAVWSTSQGRPLENTTFLGEQVSRLAGHVDPLLVLLTPLWVVFPSPLTLAAAQAAAVALGALPVFWLGRRHLASDNAALLVSLAYLAYPWLAWTALDAIHPVTFAIPLFLFGVWFLDSDRLLAFGVCAVLVAATGELMGITLAALGIWYALARRQRRAGFAIAAAGLAWTLAALLVVVPAFSGGESSFYGFYERVGGSPEGLLRTLFTDPAVIASELFAGNVLVYAIAMAAPLAGLFVLSPLAAVALPSLALYALADGAGPLDPRQHYMASIVPFLVAATVLGIARLRPKHHAPLAAMVVVVASGTWAMFGPWDGAAASSSFWYQSEISDRHVAALDRAVALVPDGVPLSVSNRPGAHLAARRYLYAVPHVGNAEWVLLDTHDLWLPDAQLPALSERTPADLEAVRRRFESNRAWETVYAEDGVYVFRRR
jgi:uncharacterized membrane protein